MFEIETDEGPIGGRGSVPEYPEAAAVLAKLKPGQSVLFPLSAMSVSHARVVAQRFTRDNEGVTFVTRQEKKGDEISGLRIHRVTAEPVASRNASGAKAPAPKGKGK